MDAAVADNVSGKVRSAECGERLESHFASGLAAYRNRRKKTPQKRRLAHDEFFKFIAAKFGGEFIPYRKAYKMPPCVGYGVMCEG